MSDKYSEEAFNALYEAINYGDANDRDRNLVSQEQVVQILEALDKGGFCIGKKSVILGDFYREEMSDTSPTIDWPPMTVAVPPDPFKFIIGYRDGTYNVEIIELDSQGKVSLEKYYAVMQAVQSVLQGVSDVITLPPVTGDQHRELVSSRLAKLFKDTPNYKGVEFK